MKPEIVVRSAAEKLSRIEFTLSLTKTAAN